MMKNILASVICCFTVFLGTESWSVSGNASETTFEDAYREYRFNHIALKRITHLSPKTDGWFTADHARKTAFLGSSSFTNLCSLSLRNQGIDDAFIQGLAASPHFPRISSIDLRGNPLLTRVALDTILASNTLGSLREICQVSGRYGRPSSEITVKVDGLEITQEDVEHFHTHPRSDFSIHYRRIMDDLQTQPSVRDSIKLVLIELTDPELGY